MQISDQIVSSDKITDLRKAKMAIKAAEVEKCLIDGADEYLQLLDYGGFIKVAASS